MDAVETLHTSQRLFARALYLYPRRFRQAYGEQVAQVFGDCSREALAAQGASGLILLWVSTLPDLLKTAAQEHFKELHMNKILSDSKLRKQLAFVLCLPLAAITLLSAIGVDPSSLPLPGGPGIISGIALLMMLFGLWLYGAPTGLSALLGLLITLPFAVMELVNRRSYGEDFPFPLFGIMWLMASVFAAILIPITKDLRSGESLKANWASLLVRGVILVGVIVGWVSLVADQMPCFVGVRYCD